MEKLKSSFKSLHGAITSTTNPITPICIQHPKTHSFEEVDIYSSFNCLYRDSAITSPSSSGHLHLDNDDRACGDDVAAAMSSSSSSNAPTIRESDDWDSNFPLGPISSERFFFTPRTTSSIMEEAKPDAAAAAGPFRGGITAVAVDSCDPYGDFRASMEEMVAAHGLHDCRRGLQELLHCYLSLNEKQHHKVIVLAFADLLMDHSH